MIYLKFVEHERWSVSRVCFHFARVGSDLPSSQLSDSMNKGSTTLQRVSIHMMSKQLSKQIGEIKCQHYNKSASHPYKSRQFVLRFKLSHSGKSFNWRSWKNLMMWNKNQILRCSELIRQSDENTNKKKLAQLYTRENWRRQTCLPACLFRIYTHTQVRETTCCCDVSNPTRPDCCCCCCYVHHHHLLHRKFLLPPKNKNPASPPTSPHAGAFDYKTFSQIWSFTIQTWINNHD